MKRQEKNPDTRSFHYHNANPKQKLTSDCVARAISTATQMPYMDTVRTLAEWQGATGYDTHDRKCYGKMLDSEGWTMQKQPRKVDGKKYTGQEFCAMLKRKKGNRQVIAHIGGHHLVAIIDYQVWDTWDSTEGCIGNYWVKE